MGQGPHYIPNDATTVSLPTQVILSFSPSFVVPRKFVLVRSEDIAPNPLSGKATDGRDLAVSDKLTRRPLRQGEANEDK